MFQKLLANRENLYEANPSALTHDAAAAFAFLTIPETEEPPQKILTLSQNVSDPSLVYLSVADKVGKPDGYGELWSGKIVDVGRKWKQILLADLGLAAHGQSNAFGLGTLPASELKTKILNHESQLKTRCYCGKMLRCDPLAVFSHLQTYQCGALFIQDCSFRKCQPGDHADGCREAQWTCGVCKTNMKLREKNSHEEKCAENAFLTCWFCGESAQSLKAAAAHPCFVAVREIGSKILALEVENAPVPKFGSLDVESVSRSKVIPLKVAMDGLCRWR